MNFSLYLFGTNKGIYIQYPNDGEEAILRPFCSNVKGAQLTIQRKDALTHYAYYKQLSSDSSQIFGICLVANGVYIKDIKALYQAFDKVFSRMIFNGKIIKLTETGKIAFCSDNFANDKSSVEQTEAIVREIVKEDLESYEVQTKQNFSGLIATKIIALEERNSEILRAIEQNSTVHIYSKDGTIASTNYIEQTISNLYKENSQLKTDYSKLMSQKKQYRNVVILILAVLLCASGLFFLNGSLNNTKKELSNAKNEISELNRKNNQLNEELTDTQKNLDRTREERDTVQKKLNDFTKKVGSSMPIIIDEMLIGNTKNGGEIETDYGNTIYSNNTMYLKPKISYIGVKTGDNIDLNVRLYTPTGMSTGTSSPTGYSYSTSLYVYSDKNETTLLGWGGPTKGHFSSGLYRFEIWYGDVCLKAKTFKIY
jgi:regulator of replication initiation timing